MKHQKKVGIALGLLACAVLLGPTGAASTPPPKSILDIVDDLYRGDSAHGTMTMRVTTEHWSRELTAEFWSKGKDHSLLRIRSPKKEKGTATLRAGDNIWNYLPKVKRTIKVPSSMMGGSWMGSHFTNDDLVRESRMADDYDFEVSFDGVRAGIALVEITCLPKEDAAVVWGKVVVEVERNSWLPLKTIYFDEDLELARTMSFSGVKTMSGRRIPAVTRIVPADKPKEFTEVVYETLELNVPVPADMFSLRRLQR